MKSNPLISILVPAYNVGSYLSQCLDSVISQTYSNLQIVVIDDGSRDNTWEICQQYAAKDKRVEIYHQENNGVAATRNKLLDYILGNAFVFVDSDDWIETEMISFLVERMRESKADIVTCSATENFNIVPTNDCSEQLWNQETTILEFLRHKLLNGSLWNKLVRRDLLHNERFQREISYGEDALFCWHLIQHLNNLLFTNRKLYHYRMNEQSLSHLSYGSKKMSGHLVWQQIAEDTAKLWPQYADIALANYAISDMWQLYYAAQCNYKKDENIIKFQKNIRKHLLIIYKTKLINKKKMLFATIAAFCYKACKWMV